VSFFVDFLVGVGGAATSLAKAVSRRVDHGGEPKRASAFAKRTVQSAVFRKMYERGDLPVRVIHGAKRTVALVGFFLELLCVWC
jgi:hypothetical protein